MLFDNLTTFKDNLALIEEDGTKITYAQLCKLVKNYQSKLPKERQLVFIKVDNSLTSMVAYIACVNAKHPVLLLSSKNSISNEHIIEKYQPNIVIDATGHDENIQTINPNKLDLHAELCLLLTTSGSTGSPKLVKLSHNNISANTNSIIEYLSLTNSDITMTSMDFNYSFGLSIVNTHLCCGATIALTNLSAMDDEFWQNFEKYQITSFSGVPYNYEMLYTKKFNLGQFKHLRYMTQAGGKLAPEIVKYFAKEGKNQGFEFFVMYGQTEASPRISYLPPEFTEKYPNSIGIPVPGGEIQLRDKNSQPITTPEVEGELFYRGPNVMMGYAKNHDDLNTKDNLTWLKTGDLAKFTNHNLIVITGRLSRFAKPFGIRLNLDDVQKYLSNKGVFSAVISVNEDVIIAVENTDLNQEQLQNNLAKRYKIPHTCFTFKQVESLPRLGNDKLNYKELSSLIEKSENSFSAKVKKIFSIFKEEIQINAGIKAHKWQNVLAIYHFYFPLGEITEESSFKTLSGDSLLYVTISLELETYLPYLPENWMELTIKELQVIATQG